MKIEGIVTLVFRDKDTGEITKTIKQENTITNYWIEAFLAPNLLSSTFNYSKFGSKIFISGMDIPATDPSVRIISNVHAMGFVESGVTSPAITLATDTTFAFGQHQQRFAPPASLININVIGLTYTTTVPTNNAVTAQAYVKLASTCTQDTNETLDIFYRVQFPYDYYEVPSPPDRKTTGISAAQTNIMVDRYFITHSTTEFISGGISSNWNGTMDHTRLAFKPTRAGGHDYSSNFTGTTTRTDNKPLQKYDINSIITIDKSIGNVVGFISYGAGSNGGKNVWSREVTPLGESVIQNIFGHGPAAVKPFFDATQLNSGDGTISLDGSTWTNPNFPKMYNIDVTATGALGVGTYKFKVRNHFGFLNNTYGDIIRIMPGMMFQNKHMHDGFEFTRGDSLGNPVEDRARPKIIRYDIDDTNTNLLCINKTEVYVFNLLTEEGVLFNVTNEPTFAPTNITQVTYDASGTIYVGCRDTGLYKIETPLGTPTITLIDNTTTGLIGLPVSKCYGVSIGSSAVLWTVFDGGVFSSADDGATWTQATFTNATIVGLWSRVKFIQADPAHVDQRLAFVYESSAIGVGTYMEYSVVWWDNNSSNDSQGKQFLALNRTNSSNYIQYTRYIAEEPWTYFDWLKPSPTQNKWGLTMKSSSWTSQPASMYPTYFTFGTDTYVQNTTSALGSYQGYIDWELHSTGSQSIILITYISTADRRFVLYRDNDTFEFNKFAFVNSSSYGDQESITHGPVCYLGNLVALAWRPTLAIQFYTIVTGGHADAAGGDLNYLLYDNYGWNGANWVKDDPGSKAFHGASEVLNDGVKIAFDDNVGAQTFVANDYYTFGVVQGVWLDGATQIDHKTGLYFKKMLTGQNTLGDASLSGTPVSSEIFRRVPSVSATVMTWQDILNVATSTPDVVRMNVSTTTYNHGARSIDKLTGTGLVNKSASDLLYGNFTFGLYTHMANAVAGATAITCGLSPVSALGTVIDRASPHYGIELTSAGTVDGYTFMTDINIIEQGVVVAPLVGRFDSISSSSFDFEIEILNDGTVNYYVSSVASTTQPSNTIQTSFRALLHTSAAPAPIVDYYADLAMNGATVGISTSLSSGPGGTLKPFPDTTPAGGRRIVSRVPDGLFVTIGDFGTSKGRYEPEFFAVDYSQNIEILIDGVATTLILQNDLDTALQAGEISIFAREGILRYSAADTGKTISGTYQVLLKQ